MLAAVLSMLLSSGQVATGLGAEAALGHVFLIVLENKDYQEVIGDSDAPYINMLAARYTLAENYFAVANPSLPNYLALISGQTYGLRANCTQCVFDGPTLADQIEASGRTWRSYQEDFPASCFLGSGAAGYVLRHNPFLYFPAIRDDPRRCQNVVPLPQLEADLASGLVPDLAWITPNLLHDMHDGTVAEADQWLAGFLPSLLESTAYQQSGAIVIVWDEGTTSVDAGCCGGATGGHVPLIIIRPTSFQGRRLSGRLSHYSLLGSLQEAWQLGRLGHSGDPDVALIDDLLGPPPQ